MYLMLFLLSIMMSTRYGNVLVVCNEQCGTVRFNTSCPPMEVIVTNNPSTNPNPIQQQQLSPNKIDVMIDKNKEYCICKSNDHIAIQSYI